MYVIHGGVEGKTEKGERERESSLLSSADSFRSRNSGMWFTLRVGKTPPRTIVSSSSILLKPPEIGPVLFGQILDSKRPTGPFHLGSLHIFCHTIFFFLSGKVSGVNNQR